MAGERTKVLITISHFLPGFRYGGPISSIINLVDGLSSVYDFRIITSDRDFKDKTPYAEIAPNRWLNRSNHQIFYLKRDVFSIIYLIRQLNSSGAKVIYLNSFFNPLFSIFIILAKKFHILKIKNILICPRGEFLEGALEFRRAKKRWYLTFARFFDLYKNIYWHATSIDEKLTIIKTIRAAPENIRVANVLSNISAEDPVLSTLRTNNEHTSSEKVLRIVFISRISKDKNIPFTFEVLKDVKAEIVFDIYGPIEDENIWNDCLAVIEKMPPNVKVKYWGSLNRGDVKKTFNMYDLFFLPSFSENFGHVISESLSVGTPVLISDKTPWKNLEKRGWGWDFSLESTKPFFETITRLAALPKANRDKMRANIMRTYSEHLNNPEILNLNKQLFVFSKG